MQRADEIPPRDADEAVVLAYFTLLMKRDLRAQQASWISGDAPEEGSTHSAKTRYRQVDSTCLVTRSAEDELSLEFAAPQWAVTPGQSAVLYDADVCLGGGIIS